MLSLTMKGVIFFYFRLELEILVEFVQLYSFLEKLYADLIFCVLP